MLITKAEFFNLLLYSYLRTFNADPTCISIYTLIRALRKIWALPIGHWAIWANLIQDGRAMTNMGGGGPPGVGAITE